MQCEQPVAPVQAEHPALLDREAGREWFEPRPDLGGGVKLLAGIMRALSDSSREFHRGGELGGLRGTEPVDPPEVVRVPGCQRRQRTRLRQ